MARRWKLALPAVLPVLPSVHAAESVAGANPVRKVVRMMQMMKDKVKEEADLADKLFDKYMCYCEGHLGDLTKSVNMERERIPVLESSLEETTGKKSQVDGELAGHRADLAATQKAMSEAKSIRDRERSANEGELAENKANVQALEKAVSSISRGAGTEFLQTQFAARLRTYAKSEEMSDTDREDILSFLDGQDSAEDMSKAAPGTMEVLGILKQMKDEMLKTIEEISTAETEAASNFEQLVGAKKQQASVLQKSIEVKLQRTAAMSVELATLRNDLDDSKQSLSQDQAFTSNLDKECKRRKKTHADEQRGRSEETVAIGDTINILNKDDALELFKKTLPSPSASFLQVGMTSAARIQAEARRILHGAQKNGAHPHLTFIVMALQGKQVGFDKVISFIRQLVHTLKNEQEDDDDKKEFCLQKLDETEDKSKSLERSIADLDTVIDESDDSLFKNAVEIQALRDGITELDKMVTEATEQRRKENAGFKQLLADDSAAQELLRMARDKMKGFYIALQTQARAAATAKAAEEAAVGDESVDTDDRQLSDEAPAAEEPQGPAFLQLRSMAKARAKVGTRATTRAKGAPPPPPETAAAYAKKTQEGGGVIAMLNLLMGDLDKQMTAAKADDTHAQEEYEKLLASSSDKRSQDAKALTDQEGNKGALEATIEINHASRKSTQQDLANVQKYSKALHTDCDWLLQNYDVRKTARADEMDALQKAEAVLKGADFSFLQLSQTRSRPGRSQAFLHRA